MNLSDAVSFLDLLRKRPFTAVFVIFILVVGAGAITWATVTGSKVAENRADRSNMARIKVTYAKLDVPPATASDVEATDYKKLDLSMAMKDQCDRSMNCSVVFIVDWLQLLLIAKLIFSNQERISAECC